MTPIPFNEAQRLETLHAYRVLDSDPDEAFDRLTRLAARHFGVSAAMISLVDEDRQWVKSRFGIEAQETAREVAFCAHAIMGESVLVVPDAVRDRRFKLNPLVSGTAAVRFYAGAPLIAAGGFRLGTFCLLDRKRRPDFGAAAREALRDFASLAMTALESRRGRSELQALEDRARRTADAQHDVLTYLAHEIRTPLSAIVGFAEVIELQALGGEISARYRDYGAKIGEAGRYLVDVAGKTLNLQHLKTGELALEEQEAGLGGLLRRALDSVQVLAGQADVTLSRAGPAENLRLWVDPTLLTQMLVNLLTNAIKYTPSGGTADISARGGPDGTLDLCVRDSGIGMDQADLAQALLPFGRVPGNPGRPTEGLGLGLPLTKQLIELHGGQLLIESAKGRGTCAILRLPAYRLIAGSIEPEMPDSDRQVA